MNGPEVILQVKSEPSVPGFNDTIAICRDMEFVFMCPAAAGPNHRLPLRKGGGRWQTEYGQIAPGRMEYLVMRKKKYKGVCLLLNRGEEVPSRVPNPNHNGALYLTEVFCHIAYSDRWRGSRGCPTISPFFWKQFASWFEVGMVGTFWVEDYPLPAADKFST